MKKRVFACLLASVMALSLAACGGGSKTDSGKKEETKQETKQQADHSKMNMTWEAEDPGKMPEAAKNRADDTIIAGYGDFAGVFNPAYWEATEDKSVVSMMNSSLSISDDKGEVTDGTATMEVSEDGLVYTYKLKPDKYSDGSPVKAEDYANYFKLIADPSYDGYQDLTTLDIKGYKDYHDGDATEIEGVKAVDDSTLQITLNKPYSSARYMGVQAYPISTKHYGDLLKKGEVSKYKELNMVNYVSNGSYILKKYEEKVAVTLEANPNFYLGEPKTKNLILKVVPIGSELESVVTGDVDINIYGTANQDYIDEALSAGFINVQTQSTLGYGYVAMNHKNPIFQDKKVRQALLYAINRAELIQAVYGEYATAVNVPQAPISWLYDDEGINTYDYDLDKAKSLLEEAGWKNEGDKLTKDGKQMKIMFSAVTGNPVTEQLIPLMIDAYKQLGIDLQAEYVDWPTLQSKSQNGDFDMFFMAWGLDADPDIRGTYASPDKGGSQNHIFYSNKDLDALFDKASSAVTQEEIKKEYGAIYKLVNEDLPVFPVYERCDLNLYNSRVKGFKSSSYVPWFMQTNIGSLEVAK